MSTANPDDRARRIGTVLKPFAFALLGLSIAMPPVVAFISWTAGLGDGPLTGVLVTYVLLCVIAGNAVLFVPTSRPARLIAAYIFLYVGGLFLVMRSALPFDADEPAWQSVAIIGIPYLVAVILIALHLRQRSAAAITATRGIDTTATVVSASVDGFVNYVQHQRLTLRFTDNTGVERYLRMGRTGGGYSAGDTLPLRFDPDRPGYKPGIVVG